MGAENLNPLDELKSLDGQVDQIGDLAGLKPIFYRLEEIAKAHAADFEVQLVTGDVKQHLINRGVRLRELTAAGTTGAQTIPNLAPPSLPPMPSGSTGQVPVLPPTDLGSPNPPTLPDLNPPRRLMSSGQFTPGELARPSAPPPMPDPFQAPPAFEHGAPPPLSSGPPPFANAPSAPPLFPTQASPAFPTGEVAGAEIAGMAPPPVFSQQATQQPPQWAPPQQAPPPQFPPPPMPGAGGPPQMPPPQTTAPQNWKRSVIIGAVVAILVGAAGFGTLIMRKRRSATNGIPVTVNTMPAGASVRVNGQPNCTSPCQMPLVPGDYQVTAFLDGYEPAASGVTVSTQQANPSLALTLEPLPQTVRILTDLAQGKVTLDNQPPADLLEGQVVLEKVSPGPHTLKVVGPNAEASLAISLADAQVPAITAPVTTRNLLAVVVTSMAGHARLTTSEGPLKLVVNGQPESDAVTGGVDLRGFQPGVDELMLGDGKGQRSMKETFGPAPTATVFLKSDENVGTLIVSTGEDNVRVFLNNKEYKSRTQRGQLRIQTLGPVSVRVAKDGFESLQAQTGEVKKGSELRLEFKMKSLPQFASLQIQGGTAGAEVLIDQRQVGVIGPNGNFSDGTIAPGDHAIEIRRERFTPRRLDRKFVAGQSVDLSGSDVVLAAERVAPPPVVEAKKAPPPPPPPPKEPAPVVAKAGTMEDFDNLAAWKKDGDVWSHRGQGFLAYKLPPNGVFQFTVQLVKGGGLFRGGRARWALDYVDSKNYAWFELDNKNFWAKEMVKGKATDRAKTQLNLDKDKVKMFTVQVDVTPHRIVHTILIDGKWFSMDSWTDADRNFTEGKFGFLVQGDDEIAISDFKFQPK